jgi:hypothetical protein
MSKLWDTYATEKDGYCEIHFDSRNELFYIKYFDNNGKMFFVEDFPNKSIRYVRDAAENWCTGIKKLDIING